MRTSHESLSHLILSAGGAIALGATAAPALAVTITATNDIRQTSATTTASCEGTEALADVPISFFGPFQALTQSDQECDGGATNAMAGAIQQSQIYPNGILTWNVAVHDGAGAGGVEAAASSTLEIEFTTDDAARFFFGTIAETGGGAPGAGIGHVELVDSGGVVIESRDAVTDGSPFQTEQYYRSVILEAGTFTYRVSAVTDSGGAQTTIPAAEIDISAYVDVQRIGDLNGDGTTGFQDLSTLLNTWGACLSPFACYEDLDGDGNIGFSDLTLMLEWWGS